MQTDGWDTAIGILCIHFCCALMGRLVALFGTSRSSITPGR